MKKKCKEVTATNLKEKNKISMERGQLRRKLRRIFLTEKKNDYRRQNNNNNKPKS